jgi:Rrf2 family iron-responsive transcriptional regulator
MLVTREMDYCVRIVRALRDGGQMAASEVAEAENMQPAVTYKMLKKLTKAGLLESRRGSAGGYTLTRPCSSLTLYDVFCAVEAAPQLTECLASGYRCENNRDGCCGVHKEFCRIQHTLEKELKRHTLNQLFAQNGATDKGAASGLSMSETGKPV